MLPFLKNRDGGGESSPVETMTRSPDDDSGFDMLEAVASDMMEAFKKGSLKSLKEALQALVEHIQDLDQDQDQQQLEGE